jgi:hypothetical protein
MKIRASRAPALVVSPRAFTVMAAALGRAVAGIPPYALWPWPVPPTHRR